MPQHTVWPRNAAKKLERQDWFRALACGAGKPGCQTSRVPLVAGLAAAWHVQGVRTLPSLPSLCAAAPRNDTATLPCTVNTPLPQRHQYRMLGTGMRRQVEKYPVAGIDRFAPGRGRRKRNSSSTRMPRHALQDAPAPATHERLSSLPLLPSAARPPATVRCPYSWLAGLGAGRRQPPLQGLQLDCSRAQPPEQKHRARTGRTVWRAGNPRG